MWWWHAMLSSITTSSLQAQSWDVRNDLAKISMETQRARKRLELYHQREDRILLRHRRRRNSTIFRIEGVDEVRAAPVGIGYGYFVRCVGVAIVAFDLDIRSSSSSGNVSCCGGSTISSSSSSLSSSSFSSSSFLLSSSFPSSSSSCRSRISNPRRLPFFAANSSYHQDRVWNSDILQ